MAHPDTLDALANLHALYRSALRFASGAEYTFAAAEWDDYQQAHRQAFTDHLERLQAVRMARKDLLATGYTVPDSWLMVQAVNPFDFTEDREGTRFAFLPIDREPLAQALREIEATALRVESEAPEQVPAIALLPSPPPAIPETPKQYLMGWPEILDALGQRNTEEDRRRIGRLNKNHGGPISIAGRGHKPMVDRDKLLAWWDQLELKIHALRNQEEGERLSVHATHQYGRNGVAVPEIAGSVKRRRRDFAG